MYQFNKVIFPLLFMVFSHFLVMGQAGYSPYTSIGIGEIHSLGLTNNVGMAGIGISNGNHLFYNNANPALLYRNSLSVFSVGMAGEYREVSTTDLSQENFTGGFNYALLGLPIMANRWTLGFGLMPYSTVNYKYNVSENFTGGAEANVFKSYEGSGGFNKVFMSNGLKITKNLSAGFTLGYLFGSIKNEVATQVSTEREINDSTTINIFSNSVTTGKRLTIGDLYFMGGLAYRMPLNEKTALNAGVTYEIGGEKDSRLFQSIRNLSYQETTNFANDTISETEGTIVLPSTLGIGVSYEKAYHWTVGVDVLLRDWSNYKGYESENGNERIDEGFSNNFSIAVGAEYIPDIASVDSYLKRMAYRIGFRHERSPFQVNKTYIKDFGINFGVSLPVRNFSSFDLSFQLGQRGTTDKNLIKEKYFKVYLGITFNDRWFVRRKFD